MNTVVGGIRPTNKLHIGNYLGALKQFVEVSNDPTKQSFFFIVDLHAITTPFDPRELQPNILDAAATYLAAGLNTENSTLFVQSEIRQHLDLAWVLNCIAPLGELHRMTQFKDKAEASPNAGLLTYPVLMAADILLYKAGSVAVGEDQVQHIELARMLARKFNNSFGELFIEPTPLLRNPLRIRSLINPEKKMSKTGDQPLYVDDEPAVIKQKLRQAVTSSGQDSAGVENLFTLLEHFGTPEASAHFRSEQKQGSLRYSELKELLGDMISQHFSELREKKKDLLAHPQRIIEVLSFGRDKASKVAEQTMKEVRASVGL